MSNLRAGTASSQLTDATDAGREAATTALTALDGEQPALAVVYVSVRYDVAAVVAAVRAVLPDVPLVGATSSGQFHDGLLIPPGDGVSVLVVTAGPYRFGVASETGLGSDPFEAGRRLARAARAAAGDAPSPHAALILLADGLAGDQQQLLSGLYRVAGAGVPIVGGAAGDDRRLQSTAVVHDDLVRADAAVAVWVASDHPLRVLARHGWQPISPPMLVTHADGAVVDRIGGRPAVEVFREYIQANAAVQEAERLGGWHSSHAFGLIEPDGSQLVRGGFIDGEDVLRTFIPLPAYAAVQVVSAGPDAVLDIVEPLVDEALAGTGTGEQTGEQVGEQTGEQVGVLLGFSCVARLDVLAERAAEEPKRLQAAAGDVPTFGFYTYGEFARTVGVAGVHNATLAAIAL